MLKLLPRGTAELRGAAFCLRSCRPFHSPFLSAACRLQDLLLQQAVRFAGDGNRGWLKDMVTAGRTSTLGCRGQGSCQPLPLLPMCPLVTSKGRPKEHLTSAWKAFRCTRGLQKQKLQYLGASDADRVRLQVLLRSR